MPAATPSSSAEAARVLALARRALEAHVRGQTPPPLERGGLLDTVSGVFVSIHRDGELRGCLGRVYPSAPLADTIADLAAAVSDSDSRFTPIRADEIAGVRIEISILSEPVALLDVSTLEIGRHGLVVEEKRVRGLLLPQVAVEHGWDREAFLDQVCVKAGLARDAWRRGARMCVFEAEVFRER